jgi:predicted RNA binding protein YcfA (HicA-like mRNA interferase family)
VWLGKTPNVSNKDVVNCLTRLGFQKQKQRSGTSHIHYKKTINGKLYKVTVDAPKAPFSSILLKSMAEQGGFKSYRQFISYCVDKKYKKKKHPLEK